MFLPEKNANYKHTAFADLLEEVEVVLADLGHVVHVVVGRLVCVARLLNEQENLWLWNSHW